jgi:hypothetical protein
MHNADGVQVVQACSRVQQRLIHTNLQCSTVGRT